MKEEKDLKEIMPEEEKKAAEGAPELSPTWAQECIEDIDDWIESQGIYLRQ